MGKKEKIRRNEGRVQGPKIKGKGPFCEVEGPDQKKKEKEEGGCKRLEVGIEKGGEAG